MSDVETHTPRGQSDEPRGQVDESRGQVDVNEKISGAVLVPTPVYREHARQFHVGPPTPITRSIEARSSSRNSSIGSSRNSNYSSEMVSARSSPVTPQRSSSVFTLPRPTSAFQRMPPK